MYGFKEDLLSGVTRDIEKNWERMGGNVPYFVNLVRKSGLSADWVSEYLLERGKVGPVCVTTVFNAFLIEEGGEA